MDLLMQKHKWRVPFGATNQMGGVLDICPVFPYPRPLPWKSPFISPKYNTYSHAYVDNKKFWHPCKNFNYFEIGQSAKKLAHPWLKWKRVVKRKPSRSQEKSRKVNQVCHNIIQFDVD